MKKTIVYHSNSSKLFTGFGRAARTLLRHLFKTGKYSLVEAANGLPFESGDTKRMPWICHGTAPNQEQYQQIASNPDSNIREVQSRMAGYGYFGIDTIVEKYKPSAVILAEDVWAVSEFEKKSWFNKTNPILWTTLDSLPTIQTAIDLAPVFDNYYVWASFAEEDFKRMGYNHVKTLYGCIDPKPFFNIGAEKKKELRDKFGISKDSLIIGLCSRNQLRKGFPHLVLALKELRERNPNTDYKLLLNTSFREGFDIPKLAAESGVPLDCVYTTYFCRKCGEFEVKPFSGHDLDCKFCGEKNTVNTVDIHHAVSDEQLNLVYNLMDIACLPLTSGGLEFFCLESKLCEIPLLVTNYSCATDAVKENSGGFPLDWTPDVEIGSNFIKARTKISSIVEKVEWMASLSEEERQNIGRMGRQFVLDNYSIDVIGKKWEQILDNLPEKDWDAEENKPQPKNPSHIPPNNLSPEDFVTDLMTHMMLEKVDKNTSHVKNWAAHLRKSKDFQGVYKHFVGLANQFNANLSVKPIDLAELLDKDDEGRRLLIILPGSGGDIIMLNSLIPNVRNLYPEYNIYIATSPQFYPLIEHLEGVHRVINYFPQLDDILLLTGRGENNGYFDIVFPIHVGTQRIGCYQNRRNKFRAEWLNQSP